MAGSNGCGCGGRIRGEGVRVIGHSRASYVKAHKIQSDRTVQNRALVVIQTGLGQQVIRIGHGA